ncbi:ATP-binding protein, partial [Streptomyces sp. URMC 123]|uniref:ATP-binding protein n=1 Tax=Streptomyces sp. URMC 123 TaxID=3423403 RepID=UPI003F52A3B5
MREALTNATKHAPGSAVRVSISHDADRTHVRVVNSPPPAGPLPGTVAGNRGLAGLRERVTVLGGTLEAGPYEGGFRVAATLPHDATARTAPGAAAPGDDARPLATHGTEATGPATTATGPKTTATRPKATA